MIVGEVHVLQKCFHWFPRFNTIKCPFHDPKFIWTVRQRIAQLLDEDGMDSGRGRNRSRCTGNIGCRSRIIRLHRWDKAMYGCRWGAV